MLIFFSSIQTPASAHFLIWAFVGVFFAIELYGFFVYYGY